MLQLDYATSTPSECLCSTTFFWWCNTSKNRCHGECFCALCQLFAILSLHRVFVLCNMQHYYCLFLVWYLKVVMWYQILIRRLRSSKTPERARAEKPASSPVLSCSLAFSGWCFCVLFCGFCVGLVFFSKLGM